MTTPGTEDFSNLHERVLKFIGAFSSTQFAIDNVIGLYLRRRLPDLGPALADEFLGRLRDDQRLTLFKAFVAQADYNGDLTHFKQVYRRAAQLRDLVGHAVNVAGPVYSAGKPPVVAVASTARRNLVPDPLYPSTFTRMTADCEWLTQHVYRAGYTAEPEMFVDGTGKPSAPPVPSALPESGEPFS